MRLTRKLTLALACAILVVLGVDGFSGCSTRPSCSRSGCGATPSCSAAPSPAPRRASGAPPARRRRATWSRTPTSARARCHPLGLARRAGAAARAARKSPREASAARRAGTARSIRWRAPERRHESLYTYYPIAIPLPGRAIEVRESLEPERAYVRHDRPARRGHHRRPGRAVRRRRHGHRRRVRRPAGQAPGRAGPARRRRRSVRPPRRCASATRSASWPPR